MSALELDGKNYNFVMASDVVRDGMGLECTAEGAPAQLLMEAFWHDPTGTFTFEVFQPSVLPFKLVEEFVREARRRLPPVRQGVSDGGA